MKYQQAKSLLDRLCDLAILFHASSELRTKMFEALDEHIPHLDQGCFERGCPMDDEPQPHKLSRDLRAALAQQAEPKGGGRLPPPLQAEPVQEPVAWSGYDLDGMVEAFSRVIEAHHSSKHPFHNPIDMDAKMALRILRGCIPAMKAYAAPPQRKPLTSDKDRPDQGTTYVEGYGYVDTRAVRAVERAHGIKE